MALAEAHQQMDADKAAHFHEVTALQKQLRDAAAALKEAQRAAGDDAAGLRQTIAETQAAKADLGRKVSGRWYAWKPLSAHVQADQPLHRPLAARQVVELESAGKQQAMDLDDLKARLADAVTALVRSCVIWPAWKCVS